MNVINRILPAVLAGCSCTLAHAATESRELANFTEIEVMNGIDLNLSQGQGFAVEVEVEDEADLNDLVTDLRGDTLRIGWENRGRGFWPDRNARVRVTLPVLTELDASGGSDVEGDGTFSGESLELNASGGSAIELDVAVTTLDVTASGGSDFELSGTADSIDVQSSGGSDVDARSVSAREADVGASGGSDITITISERLTAEASGGSDITYDGDPQDRDIDASRDSDVTRR